VATQFRALRKNSGEIKPRNSRLISGVPESSESARAMATTCCQLNTFLIGNKHSLVACFLSAGLFYKQERIFMTFFSQHAAAPCLYLTVSADGGVLFDPEKDRLLKLNATGVEMWRLLHAGSSESEVAEQLAQKYGVESGQVIGDVRGLVARAAELELSPSDVLLIEEPLREAPAQTSPTFPWYGQGSVARPAPKRSTVLFAIAGLTFFDCILSLFSLEFLCRSVKRWPLRRKEMHDPYTLIGQICTAVEKACVWYPKKALCLQRSAVTTCILRSYGVPAHLVVGVRPMPFLAHAWVEAEGSVVNDFPNVRKFYQMLTAY
jgi:hypothetical protein